MGLVEHLGFELGESNRLHRAAGQFFSTSFGTWIGRRIAPFFDRLFHRITSGRQTAVRWLLGLPVVWLTTRGRKTGESRRQPLSAFPFEDDLAVIGSNFGQRRHPGWALNLDAFPHAQLEHKDSMVDVVARRAVGDEIDRIWAIASERYRGYANYRRRANREVKLFILQHRQ